MSAITELSKLLINLIRVGAIFRISYIFFGLMSNSDDYEACKKRIKNVLTFYIIAELIFVLKDLIISYF
jgi:hypothetical protein